MTSHIVVIEDDESMREVLEIALEERGYRVHTATDGEAGLDLVRKVKPGAVILDVMMPKMNGYTVCAEIQKDRDLSETPIIMITALTSEESKMQGSDAEWREKLQIADFVSKPFNPKDLVDRVESILQNP